MLNQTRIGIGSITFHRKGPMRGQHMFSLKFIHVYTFLLSIFIFSNSASHFLEIIMLVSQVGMPNQTRIGVGSITFHIRGTRRDRRISYFKIYMFFYFQ